MYVLVQYIGDTFGGQALDEPLLYMRKRMPQRSPQRSQRGNVKNDSAIRRQVDAVVGVRSDQRLQPARDRRRRKLGSAHFETAGCGFLADRRPPILFEGHIFSRETNRQFDAQGDISNPAPGGYGAGGTRQYDRLEKAMKLQAALRSASWRIGQIMGLNAQIAGFNDVGEMINAMVESEDRQLLAKRNSLNTTGSTRRSRLMTGRASHADTTDRISRPTNTTKSWKPPLRRTMYFCPTSTCVPRRCF